MADQSACRTLLDDMFCGIPCNLKSQIIRAICVAVTENPVSCEAVHACETLTSLSDFTVIANQVCITYTDEHGTESERCFSMEDTDSVITADNGLSKSSDTNVQLGGPVGSPSALLHHSYINTANFSLILNGDNSTSAMVEIHNTHAAGSNFAAFLVSALGIGPGIVGSVEAGIGVQGAASSGKGIQGISTSGVAGDFSTNDGLALAAEINPTTNTTIATVAKFSRDTSNVSNGQNGIGGSLDMYLEASDGNPHIAGLLAFKYTNSAFGSRTSEFDISAVNAGTTNVVLQISGAGIFTLTQGLQNFTDDTAAAGGGIPVNGLYRNGSVTQIRVS